MINFLGDAVKASAEYETIMTNLSVVLGSASKAQQEFDMLKEMASKTPFDVAGLAQYATMLHSAGVETKDMIKTLTMLGDASAGSKETMSRIAVNYAQIMSVGKASAMDMRQFASAGLPVMRLMKEMGVTGQATAEQVKEMFETMTGEGGLFFEGMEKNSQTFNGLMSTMQDELTALKAELGNALLPILKPLLQIITEVFRVIQESPLLKGLILGAISGITVFIASKGLAVIGALIAKTLAAATAQVALNTALSVTNPALIAGTVAAGVAVASAVAYCSSQEELADTISDTNEQLATQRDLFFQDADGLYAFGQALRDFNETGIRGGVVKELGEISDKILGLEAKVPTLINRAEFLDRDKTRENTEKYIRAYYKDIIAMGRSQGRGYFNENDFVNLKVEEELKRIEEKWKKDVAEFSKNATGAMKEYNDSTDMIKQNTQDTVLKMYTELYQTEEDVVNSKIEQLTAIRDTTFKRFTSLKNVITEKLPQAVKDQINGIILAIRPLTDYENAIKKAFGFSDMEIKRKGNGAMYEQGLQNIENKKEGALYSSNLLGEKDGEINALSDQLKELTKTFKILTEEKAWTLDVDENGNPTDDGSKLIQQHLKKIASVTAELNTKKFEKEIELVQTKVGLEELSTAEARKRELIAEGMTEKQALLLAHAEKTLKLTQAKKGGLSSYGQAMQDWAKGKNELSSTLKSELNTIKNKGISESQLTELTQALEGGFLDFLPKDAGATLKNIAQNAQVGKPLDEVQQNQISTLATDLENNLGEFLGGSALKGLASILEGTDVGNLANSMMSGASFGGSLLDQVIQAVFKVIGSLEGLEPLFNIITDGMTAIAPIIRLLVTPLRYCAKVFEALWSAISKLLEPLDKILDEIWETDEAREEENRLLQETNEEYKNLLSSMREQEEYYLKRRRELNADFINAKVATGVNDMILTPHGNFSTAPDDYLIATKDPYSLNSRRYNTVAMNVVINNQRGSDTEVTATKQVDSKGMEKLIIMVSKKVAQDVSTGANGWDGAFSQREARLRGRQTVR